MKGTWALLVCLTPHHEPLWTRSDVWAPKCDQTEALKHELGYFLDCINTARRPINDGVAGHRIVKLLHAADQSLKDRGRIVAL